MRPPTKIVVMNDALPPPADGSCKENNKCLAFIHVTTVNFPHVKNFNAFTVWQCGYAVFGEASAQKISYLHRLFFLFFSQPEL